MRSTSQGKLQVVERDAGGKPHREEALKGQGAMTGSGPLCDGYDGSFPPR